jgi:hypothetical protein
MLLSMTLAAATLVLAIVAWVAFVRADHEFAKAIDPERGYGAYLVWRRAFPWYRGVDVFLVIRDPGGREAARRPLLRFLDTPSDAADRAGALHFEGSQVVFTKSGVEHHYAIEPLRPSG